MHQPLMENGAYDAPYEKLVPGQAAPVRPVASAAVPH